MIHNFIFCQTCCPCQLSLLLFFCFFFHFSSHFPVTSLFSRLTLPTSAIPTLYLSKPPHLVLLGCPWQACYIAQGVGSFLEYPPFWGLGWWVLVLSLCLYAAGGILQLFWLLEASLSQGQGHCLLPNTEASAQQGTSKVTWKKSRAEQAVRCGVRPFQRHETAEKALE